MTEALIPRSEAVTEHLHGQDPLTMKRYVARRYVRAAELGSAHGLTLGVELAVLPARSLCYLVPFTLGLLWGFVLGILSLLGAALYGLRCIGRWICKH